MTSVDLNALYTDSEKLLRHAKCQHQPIHLLDGKITVLEPLATPPNHWTRFKAALVNVPLLGRLETIQAAVRQVQSARPMIEALRSAAAFRKAVHERLGTLFGPEIAEQAIRVGTQSSERRLPRHVATLLTAERIVDTIQTARTLASAKAAENDWRVSRQLSSGNPPLHDTAIEVATVFARAELQGRYFRQLLSPAQITSCTAPVRRLLSELSKAGIDPAEIFTPQMRQDYVRLLSGSGPEQWARISASYRETLQSIADAALNRRKVERLRPAPAAQNEAQSSSSGTAPQHEIDIVLALCAIDPSPRFSDDVVQEAWQELEGVRNLLLRELPPLPPERVTEALRSIARGREAGPAGRPRLMPVDLFSLTRNAVTMNELAREFDTSNPESTLYSAVAEAIQDHPGRASFNFTRMMGQFGKDMLQDLDSRVPTLQNNLNCLHKNLNCAPQVPAVIEATRKKLIEHTVMAARGHLDALQALADSTTLLEEQKALLRAYAEPAEDTREPRRLDAVLVTQCERLADAIGDALPRIQKAIEEESPATLFDEMKQVAHTYLSAMAAILKNAETLWVPRSYNGIDIEAEILELCTKLALVKLNHHGEHIDPALLAGPTAGGGANTTESSAADHPVNQFLEACSQSPSRIVSSKVGMFYGDLLRLIGGGVEEKAPLPQDMPAPEDAPLSQYTPLYRIRPELLARTLTESYDRVRKEDGNQPSGEVETGDLDSRGVVGTAPNAHRIRQDFQFPAQFRTEDTASEKSVESDAARLHAIMLQAGPPSAAESVALRELQYNLSKMASSSLLVKETHRSISPPRSGLDQATEIIRYPLHREPDAEPLAREIGPGLARAISACMHEAVLLRFRRDIDAAAFDSTPVVILSPAVHELRREPDGTWRVRSTCVAHPQNQDGEQLDTHGVILYSLEHLVTPLDVGRPPRIDLRDAKAVFAY